MCVYIYICHKSVCMFFHHERKMTFLLTSEQCFGFEFCLFIVFVVRWDTNNLTSRRDIRDILHFLRGENNAAFLEMELW